MLKLGRKEKKYTCGSDTRGKVNQLVEKDEGWKKCNLFKNQMDILECKLIILEIEKTLDEFSSRLNKV